MTLQEFHASLQKNSPPEKTGNLLQALWFDAKGDWEQAHDIAQEVSSADGSWIHAYLHRKEGDVGNALYWYNRAERPMPQISLEDEWKMIVTELLSRG